MAQHEIKPAGPGIVIHYVEEFKLDWQDVEFVLPVDDIEIEPIPLEPYGIANLRTVPALKMAATYIHHGVPEEVPEIFTILQRWVVDNGYRLCGTYRVVHHHGPTEHAEYEDWITELQHEIAPAE